MLSSRLQAISKAIAAISIAGETNLYDQYYSSVQVLIKAETGSSSAPGNSVSGGVSFGVAGTGSFPPSLVTTDRKYQTKSIYYPNNVDSFYAAQASSTGFGTGTFTLDGWFKYSDTDLGSRTIGLFGTNSSVGAIVAIQGTNVVIGRGSLTTPITICTLAQSGIVAGVWQHIEISRGSGTLRLFVNGVLKATVSNSVNYGSQAHYVGATTGASALGELWHGYIDNFRITRAVRHTSDFIPTDAPENSGDVVIDTSTTWIVPEGITKISVIGVGGGQASSTDTGGQGGGLSYKNGITVAPGASVIVTVGNGGGSNLESGTQTRIQIPSASVDIVIPGGGTGTYPTGGDYNGRGSLGSYNNPVGAQFNMGNGGGPMINDPGGALSSGPSGGGSNNGPLTIGGTTYTAFGNSANNYQTANGKILYGGGGSVQNNSTSTGSGSGLPGYVQISWGGRNYPSMVSPYATWNSADKGGGVTLSYGDLGVSVATTPTDGGSVRSTIGKTSGKWYFEFTAGSAYALIGVMNASGNVASGSYPGADANGWAYYSNGNKYSNGTLQAYGATYNTGDVIGVKLDMDSKTIEFLKNGVSQGVAFTGLTGTMYAASGNYTINQFLGTANFGATAFAYPVPSGYNAGLFS